MRHNIDGVLDADESRQRPGSFELEGFEGNLEFQIKVHKKSKSKGICISMVFS